MAECGEKSVPQGCCDVMERDWICGGGLELCIRGGDLVEDGRGDDPSFTPTSLCSFSPSSNILEFTSYLETRNPAWK